MPNEPEKNAGLRRIFSGKNLFSGMPKAQGLVAVALLCFWSTYLRAQPSPDVEFRGVWVATVNNIDWPEPHDYNPESQKAAFRRLLDYYEALNFNAVIVQVRPSGDAFYPSKIVPWSRFLTGREGSPGRWKEDPLEFMIDEARSRGMEFHAWLNPYRAASNLRISDLSSWHVYHQHPDWIVRYGSRYYLDPGIPEVRSHIVDIVEELVNHYEIDGIHFDDYFYPYPEDGQSFDDRSTFVRYGLSHFEDRETWRRANVDSLVENVSRKIRALRPDVKFGISPFGVWRNVEDDPRGSKTMAGHATYDDLFADPLVWIENGWVDYLAPQLYWSNYHSKAAYPVLAKWWHQYGEMVDIYIGHGIYKVGNDGDRVWHDFNEVPRQLAWNRSLDGINGCVFYSAKSLMAYPRLAERLKSSYFSSKALSGVNYKTQPKIQAPDIKKVRARRNTLFVDLDLEDLGRAIKSVLILDNSFRRKRPKVISEQALGDMPSLQVDLHGERIELVLAYVNEENEMGRHSRVIRLEREEEGWKVDLR